MKRFARILLVIALLLCVLPVTVFANSAPPAPYYIFEFSGLPQGTVHVDLLVELPEEDPAYVPLNQGNLPDGFSETAPIVTYCEDGFRSYTFHYQDAVSMIRVDNDGRTCYFARTIDTLEELNLFHEVEIEERGQIRLAMLDASGNILKVSKSHSIQEKSLLSQHTGYFRYDAETDKLKIDSETNSFAVTLYLIIAFIGTLFNCGVEALVAIPFGLLRKFYKQVLLTNLISQVVMRILVVVLYGRLFHNFIYTLILLELLVYTGEYLVYRRKLLGVSQKRILLYTVCANTVSLGLSLVPWAILYGGIL